MLGDIVPVIAVSTGIIVPLSVFYWLYHEGKGKREAVIEIAKHLDDPSKVEDCWDSLTSERADRLSTRWRDHPVCGRRHLSFGRRIIRFFFEGIGLLVGAIGVGTMIAGYLYPIPARN